MTNTIQKRQNGNASVGFGNVFDNIIHTGFSKLLDDNFWETDHPWSSTAVPTNLRETERQFEIDLIAPGCRKEQFTLNVQDKLLTVTFRQEERENSEANALWMRNEYLPRPFTKSFTLGDTVDTEGIGATYADGILRISLPKNEKASIKARTIEVK